ncbi:NAD(P)-dependent dehydrogenase, short-chain alcohol dehydrogenase family [Paenibacillus sophorae]|uniref:NAD(P)-dependent dehydrogenase, short-chain alcohol dehydrogenase family n=1 Tax=Paenibacillus sophorae TaxID=1333845 RepID=A0A1H8F5P2_9BACL|nr:SDR family NAD(P)-dependent oxidoreductase [Paenibacillus sophorae]QWU13773.1 SDR family NAD(P)-dependent oxidoreductase [Paenibacillus sophorae]SEN27029.1 NAD(P)-dependent dehydrogenase, short-chain alcohol dehydrogenase family [Paenibacillus sophorae]
MSKDKQVALVTGGNRGIGYELVKQLALNGFRVILASRDPETGHAAVQKLKESNLDVSVVVMDVDNQESIRQSAITVNERYGRLDVLINNAGVYLDKNEKLLNLEPSILEGTMATNFFGAYYVMNSFMPLMEKQGYGRIINVSSEYGAMSELSYQGVGAYKLSKLALNGLTRLVAAEIKGDIKINAVDPGWVSSDMGGPSAPRTPKQAAESILWLATIGPEGPSGKFFRDGKQIPW